jgi:hypothetical protein
MGDAALPGRGEGISASPAGIGPQQLHELRPTRRRVRQPGWKRTARLVLASEQVREPVKRIAGQRGGIVPPLTEHGFDIGDRGPTHSELNVVPRRSRTIDFRHRFALRVSCVLSSVESAVAQVNAADEGDLEFWAAGMPQHDELLVMRATGSNPHVAQALPAGRLNVLTQMTVLLLAEREPVQMRTPDQTLDHHPPRRGPRQYLRDLGAGPSRSWSGSPRQSLNNNRSPACIARTQRNSSGKYAAPWISGSTSLPAVQEEPSRWRRSNKVAELPRCDALKNHSRPHDCI